MKFPETRENTLDVTFLSIFALQQHINSDANIQISPSSHWQSKIFHLLLV